MTTLESTCWSVIRAAATGGVAERDLFAVRYLGTAKTYLAARWRGGCLCTHLDDAVQEVMVECFRQGGVLDLAAQDRFSSFRALFYGVTRNVARRFESRSHHLYVPFLDMQDGEEGLSKLFERTWARAVMREAADRQKQLALKRGEDALQRIELLRLRFEENLPIRAIAERFGIPSDKLHHAYALARQEFRAALLEIVALHHPGTRAEVEQEAASLLRALS